MMIYAKFIWYWPRDSGVEDENLKSLLSKNWTTDVQRDDRQKWSELTWTLSSDKPNNAVAINCIVSTIVYIYVYIYD